MELLGTCEVWLFGRTADIGKGTEKGEDSFVRYSVKDELAILPTIYHPVFAHFREELGELGLRYGTFAFQFRDCFFSFDQFAENEKPFRMCEQLEHLCHLGGLLFQIVHIMKM